MKLTDDPINWFLLRSTGLVGLILLSLSLVLGTLTSKAITGVSVIPKFPRFVTQDLHRNISLLAMALLIAHLITGVLDKFVDIRWWNAFVPFGSPYQPVAIGLGALATDLLIAISIASIFRSKLTYLWWYRLHLSSYLAWGIGLVHGFWIGTDSPTVKLTAGLIYLFSLLSVTVALWYRLKPGVLDELRD